MAGLNRDIIWTNDVLDEMEETIAYYDKRNGSDYYSTRLAKNFSSNNGTSSNLSSIRSCDRISTCALPHSSTVLFSLLPFQQ